MCSGSAGPQSFRLQYQSSLAPIKVLALALSTDACPWIPPLDVATKCPCLHRGPLTHVYFVRPPLSTFCPLDLSAPCPAEKTDTAVISAFLSLSSSAFHLCTRTLACREGCRVLYIRFPVILNFFSVRS